MRISGCWAVAWPGGNPWWRAGSDLVACSSKMKLGLDRADSRARRRSLRASRMLSVMVFVGSVSSGPGFGSTPSRVRSFGCGDVRKNFTIFTKFKCTKYTGHVTRGEVLGAPENHCGWCRNKHQPQGRQWHAGPRGHGRDVVPSAYRGCALASASECRAVQGGQRLHVMELEPWS